MKTDNSSEQALALFVIGCVGTTFFIFEYIPVMPIVIFGILYFGIKAYIGSGDDG